MIIVPESAAALKGLAQAFVFRMALTFMMHRGRMSCSQAAGCIASETYHRGQLTRFLARPRWQRGVFNALAALLARANAEERRVSIAGARHSMGGHTLYPGGVAIDMLPWKRMELDEEREILKVGAGALWKVVIPYLDKRGRSVAVMQSNNSFSVGGSISVNCHGWKYGRSPLASTVESFSIMLADASIVHCSRSENQELFSLALGGYGLFGVILDVELRVVPNERYRLAQYVVSIGESLATFDRLIAEHPGAQMTYARVCIVPDRLMDHNTDSCLASSPRTDIGPLPMIAKIDNKQP